MSGNNLSVKITADVVDLQTKFAVARAEVSGLSSELNKLARASASGVIDSAGQSRLQQLAGDFAAAKTSAASLGAALSEASGGVLGISRSFGEAHGSISTATREFRALFDELSSGRTRQTPGTIAILLQRVAGLSPAMLGATGGVLALAGGLAYLGVKGVEASKALDQAVLGAQFAGNLNISREALKGFEDEMSQAANISGSDAQKIAATLASIPGITVPILRDLTAEMSDLVAITGRDGPKIAEELAKAFSSKTTAEEYVRTLGGATQAQIDMAKAADQSGDALKAQQAKFEALLPVIGRSTTTIDQQKTKLSESVGEFLKYGGAMAEGVSLEEIQADVIAKSNEQRQKQLDILRQSAAAMHGAEQSPDQALQGGLKIAQGENPMALQIEQAQAKVQALESDLQQVQGTASKANLDILNAGLEKAKEHLAELQFGPALERMRADMAQVAATWDGTQSGMLSKEIQIAQAELTNTQQSAKQRLEVETEISRLVVQLRHTTANESIAAARESVSAIAADTSQGALQRLEAERNVWQQTLTTLRQGTSQYTEAERAMSADVVAIARERQAQMQAIARSDASTDIAISKIQLDAKRSALEEEVQLNQVSAAQKLATMRQLAAESFSLDLQMLESEMSTLQEGTAEYERVYNQIRELKAKLTADLEGYDSQYQRDLARQLKEQGTLWKSTVGEIENAESSLVSDVLSRRQSMSQSLLQIGGRMVEQEISNDLRAFTTKMLLQNQEKALEQGGLLFHLIFADKSAQATAQAQAAQTSAVISGNAARMAAETSANAASKAAQSATAGPQIMADAAKAAAGAYAALSGIPIVGPVLAPVAAGVAFSAVSAYEGLASLDTGTNYVPRNMVAQIHEGEAVVPREYNPAAGGGEGGGGYSEQHNYGSVHVSALDTRGMAALLKQPGNRRAIAKAGRAYFSRGGR